MQRAVKLNIFLAFFLSVIPISAEITFDKPQEINGLNKTERLESLEGKWTGAESKLNKVESLSSDQEKFNRDINTLKEELKLLKSEVKKMTDRELVRDGAIAKAKELPVSAEDFNFLKRENEKLKSDLDDLRKSTGILRQRVDELEKSNYKR